MTRLFIFITLSLSIFYNANAQIKVLFDATKAESAANADWIIDADQNNVGFGTGVATVGGSGTESNAQRIPTPAQSGITATTNEGYWTGALSAWAVECVKKGYVVESLPIGGNITFGNTTNPQDLTNYQVFVVCEPNISFTMTEKTAILNFVKAGGGLFMIGNHEMSDRNFDGADSPVIWNDLMSNNNVKNNPFGFSFNTEKFSETTTNVLNVATHPILKGSYGNVTKLQTSGGNSLTINTLQNSTVQGLVFKSGQTQNATNVLAASAVYEKGRVFVICDSSLPDDGTGDPNDTLYDGWIADANGNHKTLIMNATIWLASVTYPPISASKGIVQNVTCFGGKNGAIPINVSGGNGTFTYLWSNGTTGNTASNLAVGKYSVTISSAAGVTPVVLKDIEVTSPMAITIAINNSLTLNCKTTSIQTDAIASGGIAPYIYKLPNNQGLITKIGTYSVAVTDAVGCNVTKSFSVTQDIAIPNLTAQNENLSCKKMSAKLSASSMDSKVTFEWSGPNNFKAFQKDTSTIWAGNYSVSALNTSNSCLNTKQLIVTENSGNTAMLVTLKSQTNASDVANGGKATIEVTKGTPPYEYIWRDNQNKIVGTNSPIITGLTKGVYICEIIDANGCKTYFTINILQIIATQDVGNQYNITLLQNPVTNILHVQSNETLPFDVFNTAGEKLFSAQSNQNIEVTFLPKGVYLIVIKDGLKTIRVLKM